MQESEASGLRLEAPVKLPAAVQYMVQPPPITVQPAVGPGDAGDPPATRLPVKFALVFAVSGAILALLLVVVGVLLRSLILQKRKQRQSDAVKWPPVRPSP